VPAAFGEDDGAGSILVQPLLVHPAAQIVVLPQHYLPDCGAELRIRNARLFRSLRKPCCLEDPRPSSGSIVTLIV
jgi:hypothetical protein